MKIQLQWLPSITAFLAAVLDAAPCFAFAEVGVDPDVLVLVEANDEPTAPVDQTQTRSEKAHGVSLRSVESPEAVQPHEERLDRGNLDVSRTSEQALLQSRDADVQRHGGEGGVIAFRLRGARAFEPRYSYAGVPLSAGQNGAEGLAFLPMTLVGGIRAFPDRAPFGESQGGIGGAVNFLPCDEDCYPNLQFKKSLKQHDDDARASAGIATFQIGSFGLLRASLGGAYGAGSTFSAGALEATQSRENFRYQDDGGTVRDRSDDRIRRREGNDFRRTAGGIQATVRNVPGFGIVGADMVGGAEERGLPGVAGADTKARLGRQFGLVTTRFQSVMGNSGAEVHGKAFLTVGRARRRDLETAFPVTSASSSLEYGGRGLILTPAIAIVRFGAGLDATRATHSYDRTRVERAEGNLKASRESERFSFLMAVDPKETAGIDVGSAFDADLEVARAEANSDCPPQRPGCVEPAGGKEAALLSAAVSLQAHVGGTVSYTRLSLTRRRPTLPETYGDANSHIPNPDLRSESSRKLEVGLSLPNAKGALFVAADRDVIFLQKAGPQAVQATNLESGSRVGGLISTDIPLGEFVLLGGSYHWLNARLRRPNERETTVPRSPKHSIKGGASCVSDSVPIDAGKSVNLTSDVEALWQSPFYVDAANLITYRPGIILSMSVGLSLREWLSSPASFSVRIQGENLLEPRARQRDAAGGDIAASHAGFPGFPEPGRRVYLSVASTF